MVKAKRRGKIEIDSFELIMILKIDIYDDLVCGYEFLTDSVKVLIRLTLKFFPVFAPLQFRCRSLVRMIQYLQ